MRRCVLILGLASSCSAPVAALVPGAAPGDEKAPPVEMNPERPVDLCLESRIDRSAKDLTALQRLGLQLSPVILEGHLGSPKSGPTGFRAVLEIQKVWFGPAFLEGTQTLIPLDSNEGEALSLPGDFLVGVGDNPFPLHGDDGESIWWNKIVISPSEKRDAFAEVLEHRVAPNVLIVQIVDQGEDRTRFRVVERVAGEAPEEFSANWSRSVYAAPFPGVSDAKYILSANDIEFVPAAAIALADVADFRPLDPSTLENVRRRLEQAAPAIEPERLAGFARDYKTSWTFHQAAVVVASQVAGFREECCTNAGGTYVANELSFDFRMNAGHRKFLTGGHGDHSEARCGDAIIMATTSLEPLPDDTPFTCENPAPADLSTREAPRVSATIPDTEGSRRQVTGWLSAGEPLERIFAEAPLELPNVDGPWSTGLPLDRALASGTLVRIEIVDAKVEKTESEVTLRTNFTEFDHDHLISRDVKLKARCLDPRLTKTGATYLAPMVFDSTTDLTSRSGVFDSGAFLIPGVLLPNLEFVHQINTRFRYRLSSAEGG